MPSRTIASSSRFAMGGRRTCRMASRSASGRHGSSAKTLAVRSQSPRVLNVDTSLRRAMAGLHETVMDQRARSRNARIFTQIWIVTGSHPVMGIVQASRQSANLAVVSDREMRLGLARWVGLLESNRRFNLQAGQSEQREVVPFVARAAADGRWSAVERRELQIYLSLFLQLFDTTVDNQRQLLATARDILAFLQEIGLITSSAERWARCTEFGPRSVAMTATRWPAWPHARARSASSPIAPA